MRFYCDNYLCETIPGYLLTCSPDGTTGILANQDRTSHPLRDLDEYGRNGKRNQVDVVEKTKRNEMSIIERKQKE
jgi:hypothetical protein